LPYSQIDHYCCLYTVAYIIIQVARDCADILAQGHVDSGLYTVHVNNSDVEVYCDMTTDGGGWLVTSTLEIVLFIDTTLHNTFHIDILCIAMTTPCKIIQLNLIHVLRALSKDFALSNRTLVTNEISFYEKKFSLGLEVYLSTQNSTWFSSAEPYYRRNRSRKRFRLFLQISPQCGLSIVCHIRGPCLNRSTDLKFRCHLAGTLVESSDILC